MPASLLPVLDRLFDDAGLFPPAQRPMAEALQAHAQARNGEHQALVGPFLCPMARLGELDACVAGGVPPPPELSLVVYRGDPALGRAVLRTGVVQVEAPLGTSLDEEALRVRCYFELPPDGDVEDAVGQVEEAKGKVKVRCGGLTPDAVPSPRRLAEVLSVSAERRMALKATAGLHHPLRHYSEALGGPQHGFLNLLAAASAAQDGAGVDDLVTILEIEEDGKDSVLSLVNKRSRELVSSIGSCSIDEPVADLQALGLL